MKQPKYALSIRQPWAWLILHHGKNVENRDWRTNFRGRIYIHAAKTLTFADHKACDLFLAGTDKLASIHLPARHELERGGIVGTAEVVDCVEASDSPWFNGPYGFVLANPEPLPFVALRGTLGFFKVPANLYPKGVA